MKANQTNEITESELNKAAELRVRSSDFQRILARRKAAAKKWHITNEA